MNDPTHQIDHADKGFYGYRMVGVATLLLIATAPGQTVVVSQFNNAISEDLGLSASALSTAYMVGTMSAALPLVFVGKLSDRFGPRVMAGVVALLFGLACALIGFATEAVTLTIGFFLLRFLGQGSLGLVSGHALALWFERRLGTMNGIKLTLTQVGFAAIPALALWLVQSVGWRTAYALLGLGVALLVVPLAIFVSRDHPEVVGQRLDGDPAHDPPGHEDDDESEEFDPTGHRHIDPAYTLRQALATPAYWILVLTISINGLIGTALIFHAQPMLEAGGLDPNQSAAILRTWSIVMMVCIFPVGWLADRLPARALLPLSLTLLALSALLPTLADSLLVMHLSMGAFGLSQALSVGVGNPAVARYFGRAHHGAIRSFVMLVGVAGTGLGPVVLGVSVDRTGSFDAGLYACVAMCVPLLLASCALRRPVMQPSPQR